MEKKELDEILKKHKAWLNGEDGGECANLSMANLSMADLSGAYLSGAYLSGANLRGAYLSGATNIPFIPLSCPSDGEFIAWKKVDQYIIKLLIPADAKRISATTEKCRCDKAICLAIENANGTTASVTRIVNTAYTRCVYEVGKEVLPDSFDDNRWNECSHGIHFFVDRKSAVKW